MSDTTALEEFFSNGNWQSGGEGDWEYCGEADPHEAARELAQLYLDRGELTFRRRQFLEMDDQIKQLRLENAEMREALENAIDLAQEGISYTSPYFIEKWGMDTRLIASKAVLAKYRAHEQKG